VLVVLLWLYSFYVDDIIITGPNVAIISSLKEFLHNQFKLKDLGRLKYFLGLEIARSSKGISLSQCHYTLQLLKDTDFLACKPTLLPMLPNTKLCLFEGDLLPNPLVYGSLIDRLFYLMVSRPNITFIVHKLSQFISQPCQPSLDAAHHLLRYLKTTLDQGLFFSVNSFLQLRAFSDVD